MIAVTVVFIIAALLAALSGLIGDEARGWLELMPLAILRLVATRLPAGQRQAIYHEEWLPELLYILRRAEGRPITRFIVGTWFAVSMIYCAGRVARTLAQAREGEQVRIVHLTDTGSAVDSLHVQRGPDFDVYRNNYDPNPGGRSGGTLRLIVEDDQVRERLETLLRTKCISHGIERFHPGSGKA